jgi:hypothetical protein
VIFVDTSAWYAAHVGSEPRHEDVKIRVDTAPRALITTDYVLAETLTLWRMREEDRRAIVLGRDLFGQSCARLVYVQPADVERAFQVFCAFADKRWSFVDCTSYAIMERLTIREALALDRHFHQMSGILVRP